MGEELVEGHSSSVEITLLNRGPPEHAEREPAEAVSILVGGPFDLLERRQARRAGRGEVLRQPVTLAEVRAHAGGDAGTLLCLERQHTLQAPTRFGEVPQRHEDGGEGEQIGAGVDVAARELLGPCSRTSRRSALPSHS